MRRYPVVRFAVIGAGFAGFSLYIYRRLNAGELDGYKAAAVAVLSAGIGYLGAKYLNVAFCKQKTEDDDFLDAKFREVHEKVEEVGQEIKTRVEEKADALWQEAKDKYISKPVAEAFDMIEKIFGNVFEFADLDKSNFRTPIVVLLALIRSAQLDEERLWMEEVASRERTAHVTPEQFERHKRFARFACKVYDASITTDPKKQLDELGIVDKDDVLFKWFEDKGEDAHCPKFILFLDHKSKSVVLAVRGTFSLADAVIDMVADEETFLDGFAHRGILRGAKKIMSTISDDLAKALNDNPGYAFVVTGHSLGAGTAEIIAMSYLMEKRRSRTDVECVALAPPPVFRSKSSKRTLPSRVSDAITIYVNRQDCVPHMSLATIAKLLGYARAVDGLDLTALQQLQVLAGLDNDEAKANKIKVAEAMKTSHQNRFAYLEHPGRINFFYSADEATMDAKEGFFLAREPSTAFSRELLLMQWMVLHHLESYYREAFDKVNLDVP